jgi:ribosomal protein L40E
MVDLIHRCSKCNQYTTLKLSDDNYFNYQLIGDINVLNISNLDKYLLSKKICNRCRISEERSKNC